jgi:hypothetical protein
MIPPTLRGLLTGRLGGLPDAELAGNIANHSVGMSPFFANHGYHPRTGFEPLGTYEGRGKAAVGNVGASIYPRIIGFVAENTSPVGAVMIWYVIAAYTTTPSATASVGTTTGRAPLIGAPGGNFIAVGELGSLAGLEAFGIFLTLFFILRSVL